MIYMKNQNKLFNNKIGKKLLNKITLLKSKFINYINYIQFSIINISIILIFNN